MKDEDRFYECYSEIMEIIMRDTMTNNFKECTEKLKYPEVGTDKKTGEIRKVDWGGLPVIESWIREGFQKSDKLLKGLLDNHVQ